MDQLLQKLTHESGFETFRASSKDVKLLCSQRFFRLFAYGATFIILVQFLSLGGHSDAQVGLFMTLTLLGDVLISLVLSLITDQVGRKLVLSLGCLLMTISGMAFTMSSNYWVLLLAATFGVISPSGSEIGPFRAIEESVLSQLTQEAGRSDVFAWYNMCGTGGAAIGTLLSGWIIQLLQNTLGWPIVSAYQTIFVLYALLGLIKLGLTVSLSHAVEPEPRNSYEPLDAESGLNEMEPLQSRDDQSIPDDGEMIAPTGAPELRGHSILAKILALIPPISRNSLSTLIPLLFLFALDSFSSGLASPSWLTYFFTTYHRLSPSYLGTLFFTTNIIATLSNLAALPIARRLGPLRTMIFTHLPSAIFLGLVPVPGMGVTGTWFAVLFLALRACTQSMDQAPRQAFIAAAVRPEERTAVLGTVNTGKTLAQAAGTGLAGVLAERRWWMAMFGGAGLGKATYDLLLLWMFHLSKW